MTDNNRSPVIGKLLILAILGTGLLLAGFSWWFRYASTHRAAQFWGIDGIQLIRDASSVQLFVFNAQHQQPPTLSVIEDQHPTETFGKDVSRARGLTHLRNALLEDRSFDWESSGTDLLAAYGYALKFRDETSGRELTIFFSADCTQLARRLPHDGQPVTLACSPIAQGLRTVFAEQTKR